MPKASTMMEAYMFYQKYCDEMAEIDSSHQQEWVDFSIRCELQAVLLFDVAGNEIQVAV
jgi:hypothetical protein